MFLFNIFKIILRILHQILAEYSYNHGKIFSDCSMFLLILRVTHSTLQFLLFFVFFFSFFSLVFLDRLAKAFSCFASVNFIETCDQYRAYFIRHTGKLQSLRLKLCLSEYDMPYALGKNSIGGIN